jgi:peroxiredoxin
LLSDRNNEVARKFGLVYRMPDYQQSVYRRAFVNLPHVNGDNSWELPVPAAYIVDRGGIIRYSSVNPDYSERPEPADILKNLQKL